MLSVDARIEIFKQQFPKEKIKSVQVRQGSDHEVIEINHIWMCKSAKEEQGIAALAQEARVLKLLEGKISTKIPVPVYVSDNFLVYKKIAGSPLIPYAFYRFGAKTQSRLIFGVAQFLHELHNALTQEEIAFLDIKPTDWPWSVEKLESLRPLLQDNQMMVDVFDSIMKVYKEERSAVYMPALIHNDIAFSNIIVDPLTGKLHGIIDFTDVAYDDPAFDFRLRRENPVGYARSVATAHAMITGMPINIQKFYAYYFATEFSRYFQYVQADKLQEAKVVFQELVRAIHDFLIGCDCVDGKGSCSKPALDEMPVVATSMSQETQQVI